MHTICNVSLSVILMTDENVLKKYFMIILAKCFSQSLGHYLWPTMSVSPETLFRENNACQGDKGLNCYEKTHSGEHSVTHARDRNSQLELQKLSFMKSNFVSFFFQKH